MLVLSRRLGEGIVIGDSIVVSVVRILGNRVQLGIEAPAHMAIRRQELSNDPVPPLAAPVQPPLSPQP